MLFNSLAFFIFLPVVFILYWFVFNKSLRWQNMLIVVASYLFYGWWDWRFLGLILFSTVVDYLVALQMVKTNEPKYRKYYLMLSLFVNLGLLGFFKYYHFFIDSWVEVWGSMGVSMDRSTLQIILPVGISFYTFQTLSYTIDVYRKKLEARSSFVQFAAYVSFFPQLVAGPIERATHLLPQFQKSRVFKMSFAWSGIQLILWGMFKKVVVADTCAFFVQMIFGSPGLYSWSELLFGALLFAFQIYGDFSGYSDIAIGTGRLFGFDLMTNFRFPYFSRNIPEFWRRWHISLTTWFRDYVYIPLGGSQGGLLKTIRNVCVVFLISGFWHGANWTFILWGLIHALLFLPFLITKRNRSYVGHLSMRIWELPSILLTFLLVVLAWVFFRAPNMDAASDYLWRILSFQGHGFNVIFKSSKMLLFAGIIGFSTFIMLVMEGYAVQKQQKEVQLNGVMMVLLFLVIWSMGMFKNASEFIYFQF